MATLTLSFFKFFTRSLRKAEPKTDATAQVDDIERRKILGDMIAAGACDSEYGVQMLLLVFPDEY